MKKNSKVLIKLLLICLMLQIHLVGYATEPADIPVPVISGQTAIVMNMDTMEVLYEKDPDVIKYPASITKILTTMIALENSEMTDKVLVTQAARDSLEVDASEIELKAGEEITMQDALYATMLMSANEAAFAVAENAVGDYSAFIQMMNDKAKEVGAVNSNFVNPSGLNHEDHYTTARDMALISIEAFQNPTFREIIIAPSYEIPPTNMSVESKQLLQRHQTVIEDSQYYREYSLSGKSGYTNAAGYTLVTFAQQGDMRIVSVVMQSQEGMVYNDTVALLDYAFAQFHEISYLDMQEGTEISSFHNPVAKITVPKTTDIAEFTVNVLDYGNPQEKKGVVEILRGTEVIATESVTISDEYYQAEAEEAARVQEAKEKEERRKELIRISIYAGGGLLCITIIVIIIVAINRRKNADVYEKRQARKKWYKNKKNK